MSYKYFKTSPEIIQLAVMYYVRYPLSYRQVEDILSERGIDICHESIRFWVTRFGASFAKKIRNQRAAYHSNWRWHLDQVFVKIDGEKFLLWRAVDHEGEVLEAFVSKRRCKRTALKFIKKLMKKYCNPHEIVTDKLASYGAALNTLGASNCKIQRNITTTDVKTLTFHFEGERGQCRSFEVPLHCRDLPPYTVPFTTILITKDI